MSRVPTLSLVVCTYRRPRPVESLLSALEDQLRRCDEVLVVDASPDRETREVVGRSRLGHLVRYIEARPEHRGLTRQRNLGIEAASGEFVAFLDDDTVPEPSYFAEVLACFSRHPDAAGVGGYIANEVTWARDDRPGARSISRFRVGGWARREDVRWRLRRLLGLDATAPPGWLPRSGHGRPVGAIPPDGDDHRVECVMGGASTWRRRVFYRSRFSQYFEGYGLYEDLDFCVRVSAVEPIYLATRARLAHHHAPEGRPAAFRYGVMVSRNGWFVWRRRWPRPAAVDRARWWATSALLLACRAAQGIAGPLRAQAASEAAGRLWGLATLLWRPPVETAGPAAIAGGPNA